MELDEEEMERDLFEREMKMGKSLAKAFNKEFEFLYKFRGGIKIDYWLDVWEWCGWSFFSISCHAFDIEV